MKMRQVSCILTFWSRDLTISQMSTIAGMIPDASAERNMTSWGARVNRDSAFWEIRSRTAENAPLELQIADIFARISESRDALIALRDRVDDCQLLIATHSSSVTSDNFGFHLELDQVVTLAALRAEIDFEAYIEDDD
jgi:Domain of unknown function (DUF4279)